MHASLSTAGNTNFRTPPADIEAALAALGAHKRSWAATGFAERAALARRCAAAAVAEAEGITAATVAYKGAYEHSSGEERLGWMLGPQQLCDIAESLELAAQGKRREPLAVHWRDGKQAVLRVFPSTLGQHLSAPGFAGDLWLRPGAAVAPGADARQGGPGEVVLVLGAGNHAVLAVADVAHHALVHGAVCVLKMNPVNEWAGPFIERALAPLAEAGALRVVYGGAAVGAKLAEHAAVDSVHITGSDATYDAIVWRGAKKAANKRPPFGKKITAELGCVTPYIMVPGAWSESDLEVKATDVVAMVASNASCNCLAAKVLVLSRHWAQRDAFLAALRRRFAAAATRFPYYPGAAAKWEAFAKAYAGCEVIGASDHGELRYLLLPPAPPAAGELALTREAWSPVLAIRELDTPAGDAPAFMAAAASACNTLCWGTLSCSVYCHPATEAAHRGAFEALIAELRYGAIGVNVPSVFVYRTPGLTWGGFPNSTPDDIGSGAGVVWCVLASAGMLGACIENAAARANAATRICTQTTAWRRACCARRGTARRRTWGPRSRARWWPTRRRRASATRCAWRCAPFAAAEARSSLDA